ncbi:hypothetical protein SEA_JOHNDOE_40 [Arthrobacter phage JohnDoe]|nr:hypothetical protein SEA_JOHNDOE_40 [Arthrobacter phage JohnDoe]
MDLWTTPIFELLKLEYPDLVWHQDEVTIRSYDGSRLRTVPTGRLRTL